MAAAAGGDGPAAAAAAAKRPRVGEPPPVAAAGACRLLLGFRHRLLGFRRAEVECLARRAGHSFGSGPEGLRWERVAEVGGKGAETLAPFWYVRCPSAAAARRVCRELQARAILVKSVLEFWGAGATAADLQASVAATVPAATRAHFAGAGYTYKIAVDGFGESVKFQRQMEHIRDLQFLGFQGKVDLKRPDHTFVLHVVRARQGDIPVPERMDDCLYFGRCLALPDRAGVHQYDNNVRPYIGPTSMDNEIAFLMNNYGLVGPGSVVYDPFVGTGSILVPAAHMGALTFGADIDIRVVQWGKTDKRGNPVDIWSNFTRYGLPAPLGVLRCDSSQPPFRDDLAEWLDAVVCDPPYGVRAGGRKGGGKRDGMVVPAHQKEQHIPSTRPYQLSETLVDLLNSAVKLLRPGGRLVYFTPSFHGFTNDEDHIPRHPCLELLYIIEQPLQMRYSRKLVVMEKVHAHDPAACAAFKAAALAPGSKLLELDRVHELVYDSSKQDDRHLDILKEHYQSRGKMV